MIFCSIFHRWEDWIDTESDIQIRWCRGCNKRQRRLAKLKRVTLFKFSFKSDKVKK